MFREMRRSRQALSRETCEQILKENTSGVLAVSGNDGYPYAVPLSYVYEDGVIYFHGAPAGHKIDAIAADGKVSFCVVSQDEIHPEKYTAYYRSVIAFGKAQVITDEDEKWKALLLIAGKYAPLQAADHREAIGSHFKHACIIRLSVEHMSGKEALALVTPPAP